MIKREVKTETIWTDGVNRVYKFTSSRENKDRPYLITFPNTEKASEQDIKNMIEILEVAIAPRDEHE